jgi:hypothetical protein
MTGREIQAFVDAEPFQPFRIHMASGRTFDVRHPEMIRIGRTSVTVFAFSQDDERFYMRVEMLGLLLIESISVLDTSVASSGSSE